MQTRFGGNTVETDCYFFMNKAEENSRYADLLPTNEFLHALGDAGHTCLKVQCVNFLSEPGTPA